MLPTSPRAFALVLLILRSAASPCLAQDFLSGSVADPSSCAASTSFDPCSLIQALRQKATGPDTDWLLDHSRGSGPLIGFETGDIAFDTWSVRSDRFREAAAAGDVTQFVASWSDGWIALDSGPAAGPWDLGRVALQHLGSRSPHFPSTGPALPAGYGTMSGIEVRFAPLVVRDDTDRGGCTVGGAEQDPGGAQPGFVVGYNILRAPGVASVPCAQGALVFQYFVDLRTLDFDCVEPLPPGPDLALSPCDLNPEGDLVGLVNPDGLPDTGDEVIVFGDTDENPDGTPRSMGTAPFRGQGYWYALQAVVAGSVSEFASVTLGSAGDPPRDMRADVDRDGLFDAVSPDGASVAFWSPQAEYGLPGLGLVDTCGGGNCSCRMFFVDYGAGGPLPALGRLELEATVSGRDVLLEIATGFETADVVGFRVYRVQSGERRPVGDTLIAARGGDGNVYRVVDAGARRAAASARAGLAWEVDVLHSDGTPVETFGPFTLAPGRRSR